MNFSAASPHAAINITSRRNAWMGRGSIFLNWRLPPCLHCLDQIINTINVSPQQRIGPRGDTSQSSTNFRGGGQWPSDATHPTCAGAILSQMRTAGVDAVPKALEGREGLSSSSRTPPGSIFPRNRSPGAAPRLLAQGTFLEPLATRGDTPKIRVSPVIHHVRYTQRYRKFEW